jgi:hypothetical protein
MQRRALTLAALVVGCSAASTATVLTVAGTYSMSIVDGTNPCNIPKVTPGQVTAGVSLAVVQEAGVPQNMTVTLGGTTGTILTDVAGTNVLQGTLGGNQVTLVPAALDSGVPTVDGSGCSYSTNVSLAATFAGDTVQGLMTYTLTTTGNSCGTLSTCQTVQALAGALTTPADQ